MSDARMTLTFKDTSQRDPELKGLTSKQSILNRLKGRSTMRHLQYLSNQLGDALDKIEKQVDQVSLKSRTQAFEQAFDKMKKDKSLVVSDDGFVELNYEELKAYFIHQEKDKWRQIHEQAVGLLDAVDMLAEMGGYHLVKSEIRAIHYALNRITYTILVQPGIETSDMISQHKEQLDRAHKDMANCSKDTMLRNRKEVEKILDDVEVFYQRFIVETNMNSKPAASEVKEIKVKTLTFNITQDSSQEYQEACRRFEAALAKLSPNQTLVRLRVDDNMYDQFSGMLAQEDVANQMHYQAVLAWQSLHNWRLLKKDHKLNQINFLIESIELATVAIYEPTKLLNDDNVDKVHALQVKVSEHGKELHHYQVRHYVIATLEVISIVMLLALVVGAAIGTVIGIIALASVSPFGAMMVGLAALACFGLAKAMFAGGTSSYQFGDPELRDKKRIYGGIFSVYQKTEETIERQKNKGEDRQLDHLPSKPTK